MDLDPRRSAPLPEHGDSLDAQGAKHLGRGHAAREADTEGDEARAPQPVHVQEPRQEMVQRGFLPLGQESALTRGLCHQRHPPSLADQRKSLSAKLKIRSSERPPPPTPCAKPASRAATSETSPIPVVRKFRSSPSRRSAPSRI